MISCMSDDPMKIVENTGIQSDVLVIDQCDKEEVSDSFLHTHKVRVLYTKERGLSRSRNMAILNSEKEIGLICDDDEKLNPGYADTIVQAYKKYPDADIICFRMSNQESRLKQEVQVLNKWTCMRISSWQISMKVNSVRQKHLGFDPYMGAGSGNGAGEEVKFLRDCIKAGMKVYYVPVDIGTVNNDYYESGDGSSSQWFRGFDEKFFYQRGMVNRYMLGVPVSLAYAAYYSIVKKDMYKQYITPWKSFTATVRGIIGNDIEKQKRREKAE